MVDEAPFLRWLTSSRSAMLAPSASFASISARAARSDDRLGGDVVVA